jgi:hypothetical protein
MTTAKRTTVSPRKIAAVIKKQKHLPQIQSSSSFHSFQKETSIRHHLQRNSFNNIKSKENRIFHNHAYEKDQQSSGKLISLV